MTADALRTLRKLNSQQLCVAFALAVFALALNASATSAKQVVDYFGTATATVFGGKGGEFRGSAGIAVNQSGAGVADAGDIYVVDRGLVRQPWQNRIQRFHRDDNDTPSNLYDDEYEFVSAWGADVVQSGGVGDLGDVPDAIYEICTVAAQCKLGVASGGNGSVSGNGALTRPTAIAVDQDTGNVYVADARNHRINVYAGDGIFLRSFGWDVIAAGSGNLPNNEQQTVTLGANTTGGSFNLSVETGTGWGTFEDTNNSVDVQNTITDVEIDYGSVHIGDAISGVSTGLTIPAGSVVTAVDPVNRTITISKEFNLTLTGDVIETHRFALREVTSSIPHNAPASGAGSVQVAIEALPSIEPGDIAVGGPAAGPYVVDFQEALTDVDVGQMIGNANDLTVSSGAKSVEVATTDQGASYEVCVAGTGEVCQEGAAGSAAGQLGGDRLTGSASFAHPEQGIALSQPDGNPTSGTAFVADAPNRRVNTYDLDGADSGSFGSPAVFSLGWPERVAVDSRGIAYASNGANEQRIERYDSQGVHGPVGFLAPIGAGVNEVQEVKIAATAGTFRLSFDPDGGGPLPAKTSADIPHDVFASNNLFQGGVREVLGSSSDVGGGPGDATGSKPYKVTFTNLLGAKDVPLLTVSNGSVPLSGGAGASVTTTTPGQPGLLPAPTDGSPPATNALSVDPDGDGGGPDSDVLYVGRGGAVQQFGPLNDPGLTAAPVTQDDQYNSPLGAFTSVNGLAVQESDGRIYVAASAGAGQSAHGVYVIAEGGPAPEAQINSIVDVTDSSATVQATIDPNGPPTVSYRFEYSLNGTQWTSLPEQELGTQEDPQQIEELLSPPGIGFDPETLYHVRLRAAKAFTQPVLTAAQTFTTDPAAPQVETVGSPLRTATTAQLAGRVNPRGATASFHFEYVTEVAFQATGFTDLSSGGETAPQPAGSGSETKLVGAQASDLQPGTAYRYRVVADNGNSGSPVAGEPVAVTTRANETPLSHGELPGPPGSDRAYEQVNVPETGGNPVVLSFAAGFSVDGERALYGVAGGTPLTETGTVFSQFLAERTTSGWQPRLIFPRRKQLEGPNWLAMVGDGALENLYSYNFELGDETLRGSFFRFGPDSAPEAVYDATPQAPFESFFAGSADGSRLVAALGGAPDPTFPAATAMNLYELASGTPHLVSVLPGDTVAACGVAELLQGGPSVADYTQHWVSYDGRFAIFPSRGSDCSSNAQLYARDLLVGETELISGPPLSGPACQADLIKSTPGAAFFKTGTRLVAEDEGVGCAAGADVYRYNLQSKDLECVTCVVAGLATEVVGDVGVAADGSRIYFQSLQRLLAGTVSGGAYRVMVQSGELAYVGDLGTDSSEKIGDNVAVGQAMNADGSVAIFRSDASFLNPLGDGHDNGGEAQYYRYDDRDRSLVCVSCPADGSAPREAVSLRLNVEGLGQTSPGLTYVSDDGDLVFRTTEPLLVADQNTPPADRDQDPGIDIYEWRDGRLLLITDGFRDWLGVNQAPQVAGISRSGRDVFFLAAAPLTPDAPDGYYRLYDARIGGGFEFPEPPPPCALEVCQGTPKGVPEELQPGTGTFVGPGNVAQRPTASRCPKGRRKVQRGSRARCVKRKGTRANKGRNAKQRTKANDDRRASR